MKEDVQPGEFHGVSADTWHALFARQTRDMAVPILSLLALVLACVVLMLLWRGTQIHFVSLGRGVQAARPGEVPRAALEEISLVVVSMLGNVTPEGMPKAIARAKEHMTGPFRILFAQRIAPQSEIMHEHEIVMLTDQLAVAQIEKVENRSEPTYRIYIQASRMLWVGALPLHPTPITVMVEVAAIVSDNPDFTGLWINDMEWPIPHVKDQEIADALSTQSPRGGRRAPGRQTRLLGRE